MIPPTELLPTGIPPDRDSPQTGLLPENSSRNGIPPETGFLPKRDSSRNGIPPKKNILQFWEESWFGRNPISGGIPGGRSSAGGILGGRSSLGGILFFSCVERFKMNLLYLIPGDENRPRTLSNEVEDFNLCLYLK